MLTLSIALNTLLLGVVAYFLRRLISKLDGIDALIRKHEAEIVALQERFKYQQDFCTEFRKLKKTC